MASLAHARESIFDDDSTFMQGFETGIMMRSKNSKIEEYGCSVPDDRKDRFKSTIDTVATALDSVKNFLPEDNPVLRNSFGMVLEFVTSMGDFMMVFAPDANDFIDNYCRGMIFGLHGSGLLVRVANMIREQDLSSEVARPGKKGKKKGGSFDMLGAFKEMGQAVLTNVAQEMVNKGAGDGEL